VVFPEPAEAQIKVTFRVKTSPFHSSEFKRSIICDRANSSRRAGGGCSLDDMSEINMAEFIIQEVFKEYIR